MKTGNGILRAAAISVALFISPTLFFQGIAFAQGVQAPSYTIAGTVLDAAADPVPGVIVADGTGHTATTAANGTYILTTLDGSYTLTATKSGDVCTPAFTNPVSVPPNATGKNFTCPNYTIAGTVLDAAADPVPGVIVTDGSDHKATTAANGTYTLITTAGSYTLTASKSDDVCTPGFTNPVSVPPNATGKNFTCPDYTISGTVRDASNNLLQGVSVTDGAGQTVNTNANGTYTLITTAGSYTLTASKSGVSCSKTVTWTNPVSVPPNATGKDFTCPIYTIFMPLVVR